MDDTELTYKFWRIRKTVMQVKFKLLLKSALLHVQMFQKWKK